MDDSAEIIAEFLVESHENLDTLDRDLVALEQSPGSRELLASVFRTIHTIKGTSGFLAFGQLERLTHVGETLLARLRDGELTMTPVIAEALLRMVDVVRDLLAGIEATGSDAGVDVSVAEAQVVAALDAGSASPPPVADPPVADELVVAAPAAEIPVAAAPTAKTSAAATPVRKPAARRPTRARKTSADLTTQTAPVGDGEESGPKRSVADSSIRVDVDLLDSLMRLVGELVLTRNQVVRQASLNGDADLLRTTQRLNIIASELQEGVMKTRMQPMEHVWSKFPRVVRDLGVQCGKNVTLEMVGQETELDRTLLEAVKDPLTHLVRNSVDHGIETAADRVAAGKPAHGTVSLRAFHEGGQVVVEVADDGAGIDPPRIGASAVAKGLITDEQLQTMSPTDMLQLIFRPGFSTAKAVTNVSGRGVGMDVVKTNIENIGGTIEIESEPGHGTTCRLRIPLTLAIVPALTVDCTGNTYAIPQVNLLELVALGSGSAAEGIENVGGAEVYRLRGQLLPLVRLSDQLHRDSTPVTGPGVIAVLQSEGRRFGLVVERVVNTEEIVVKPLSRLLKGIGVFSGATILGDGRVGLILDIQCMARAALRADTIERLALDHKGAATQRADEQQMLVVGLGGGRRIAIPLGAVTRLEEVRLDEIEHVGHREVVRRGEQILPLIRLDSLLGSYGDSGAERAALPVVVYASDGRSVAMAVEAIVDIVDATDAARSDLDDSGVLGSLVIKERVTELLDVRAAILAADPRFYSVPAGDGGRFDAGRDLITSEAVA